MSKVTTTNKELFSILGEFKLIDNKKKFIPKSERYFLDQSYRAPLNKEMLVTFSTKIPSRSSQQLSYYFVVLGYIADYNGNSVMELHDAIMREKFGVKRVKVEGLLDQYVRESVSNKANFPKDKMAELIEYALNLASELGVEVPTAESLGYISN